MTYSVCTYKCIRGSGRRQDHEGYKEGSRYFGYMELCQNQEKAVRAFVRGLNNGLHLNTCSACVKTTCHTHVHFDNYIPVCQAKPTKVTILIFRVGRLARLSVNVVVQFVVRTT